MPGAWQGSNWSANFEVTGMTRPGKIPSQAGFDWIFGSQGERLKHKAREAVMMIMPMMVMMMNNNSSMLLTACCNDQVEDGDNGNNIDWKHHWISYSGCYTYYCC